MSRSVFFLARWNSSQVNKSSKLSSPWRIKLKFKFSSNSKPTTPLKSAVTRSKCTVSPKLSSMQGWTYSEQPGLTLQRSNKTPTAELVRRSHLTLWRPLRPWARTCQQDGWVWPETGLTGVLISWLSGWSPLFWHLNPGINTGGAKRWLLNTCPQPAVRFVGWPAAGRSSGLQHAVCLGWRGARGWDCHHI